MHRTRRGFPTEASASRRGCHCQMWFSAEGFEKESSRDLHESVQGSSRASSLTDNSGHQRVSANDYPHSGQLTSQVRSNVDDGIECANKCCETHVNQRDRDTGSKRSIAPRAIERLHSVREALVGILSEQDTETQALGGLLRRGGFSIWTPSCGRIGSQCPETFERTVRIGSRM